MTFYTKFCKKCLILMYIYLMGQVTDCMSIRSDRSRQLNRSALTEAEISVIQHQKPTGREITERAAQEVESQGSFCKRDSNSCPYINRTLFDSLGPTRSLNLRSTSPWTMVVNRNPNRSPYEIYEACCVCLNCVDLVTMNRSSHYISIPIKVKRKISIWNGREHKQKYELISVGCTCAVPGRIDNETESN